MEMKVWDGIVMTKTTGKEQYYCFVELWSRTKILIQHKQTKQTVSLVLEHGSLLIMKYATQSNWLHSLPKSKNITQPRINLTSNYT